MTDERAAGSCPCSDLVRRAVGSGPPRLPPPAADKDFQPLTRCPEQPRRLPAPRGPGGRVGGHLKGPREEATLAWGPSARVAHSWTRLSASRPDPSGRVGRPRLLSPAFLSVSLQTRSLSPAIRAMAGSAAPPNPGPRAGTEAVASPHSSYRVPPSPSRRRPLRLPLWGGRGEDGSRPGQGTQPCAPQAAMSIAEGECAPRRLRVHPRVPAPPPRGQVLAHVPCSSPGGTKAVSAGGAGRAGAEKALALHALPPTHEAGRTAKASG